MKLYWKIILSVMVGAALGGLYYYFFACRSGCPITSNPYTSIIYGGLFGLVYALPFDKLFNGKDSPKK